MKKTLILHGFEGSEKSNWFVWLAEELTMRGYEVRNVTYPNSAHPDLAEILPFLREKVADFTDKDIIIGHSLGGYLALKLAEEKKFGELYIVAPALGDLPYQTLRDKWEGSDVDALERTVEAGFDLSKVHASKKTALFSADDPWVPMEQTIEKLDDSWEIIRTDGCGHFRYKEYRVILDMVLV
jgi:predicted alpha/beta hydrolase family esterase